MNSTLLPRHTSPPTIIVLSGAPLPDADAVAALEASRPWSVAPVFVSPRRQWPAVKPGPCLRTQLAVCLLCQCLLLPLPLHLALHLLQLLLRRRALLQVLPAKPLHPPWLTMLLAIFVLLLLLHRLLFFRVVYIIRVATAILLTETVFSNMCEFGVSMFESSFDGRPSSRLA